MEIIISTILSTLTGMVLGYLIKKIKSYSAQNEALMILLQSNLTNTYFAYDHIKQIPDYVYRNWVNELAIYEKLGGNEFVHVLAEKIKTFEIIHTDILN